MWVTCKQGIRWMVKKKIWDNSSIDSDINVYNPCIGWFWKYKKDLTSSEA